MHVLSSLMGIALPSILPRRYTHFASAVLFLYFGGKLLYDAYESKADGPSEELQEVEEELATKKEGDEPDDEEDAEAAHDHARTKKGDAEKKGHAYPAGAENLSFAGFMNQLSSNPAAALQTLLLTLNLTEKRNVEVFSQALTLTFLAEWGDRSQIATIALASVKNPYGVIIGGLLGHAFCTGLAVIGGRMLAARISERTVAIIGGLSFLGFGVHSFLVGP